MRSSFLAGLLLTILLGAGVQAQVSCGDCNANGSGPDILDALTAAQISAGISLPSMVQICSCDVDNSGTLSIIDALLMAQAAAGLPVTLMCVTPTCVAGGGGATPTVTITAPAGGTQMGNITITLNADDADADPLTITFEWSTNGGTTYSPATTNGAGSLVVNPALGVPVPVVGGTFVWTSVAGGVGTAGSQAVTFRVGVSDGTLNASDTTTFDVDNSGGGGGCPAVTCGGFTPGTTGPGTAMAPPAVFTPGPAGDSQAFVLDVSGRAPGQNVRVSIENISDDCDLFVTDPGTMCGDPTGALWRYSASGGIIGLGDEFHTFDDATATAFGNMIPIWVYHYDPAPTATFDVRVACTTPMMGTCTTVTCGATSAGMTGPGTAMAPVTTFTPGPGGDSQGFLLDVSGRPAGSYVFVSIENISDDCDLFVPTPGTACGDPTGALWGYSHSGGLIGLPDEFHSFDDATCTAFGNMVPIWVYHYDPAPTATFTVRVQCFSDPCPAGTVDRVMLDVDAPFLVIDDNAGADDTVAIGCGFMGDPGGPDRVYYFRPATTATYSFVTCASPVHQDTMLSIRTNCVAGTEIACNDDSAVLCVPGPTGPYLSEMASVPLTAGTGYYIVVDGWAGATGTYFLEVTSP